MPPPNAEALLENAGWIRALCRSLVRDPHRAEDAVQETFVRALESGPREPRAMRQWLRTVARNAVFQRGRQESARREREERVSRRVAEVPSPAEALQKASMRRQIVEAVLELDEPYRTTVVLRYFEELSTEEVARARGITPSTVRSQIQRAMRHLRRKLAAEFDEEEAGMPLGALLLLMAHDPQGAIPPAPGPSGGEAAAGTGASHTLGGTAGLSAGAIALVQAAGLTAVTLGGIWWLLGDGSQVAAGRTPWGHRRPLTIVDRPGREAGAFLGRSTPMADRPERLNSLLVLDAVNEAALEGVRVEVVFHGRDPSGRLVPQSLGLGESGHGGGLVLRLPEAAREIATAQTELLLTRPDYLPRRVDPEELFELPEGAVLQVGMLAEGTLDVALVDADENPLPGLAIRARPRVDAIFGTGDTLARETHLDNVGQASLTGLPAGVPIDLELSADGGSDGYRFDRRTVRIDPRTRHSRIVLSAPATTVVEGTLVDPGGSALEGATVSLIEAPVAGVGATPARISVTDEMGRFRFERARSGPARILAGPSGTPLEVELLPDASLDLGRITGPELVRLTGDLVPPSEAAPHDPVLHAFRAGQRIASVHAGPEGHFEFELPPGDLQLIATDGPLEGRLVLANVSAAAPASGLSVQLEASGDAVAEACEHSTSSLPPVLSVVAVDPAGVPVPDALVTLVVRNQGREAALRYLTDADGRVELPTAGAGGLPLRVEAERLGVGIAASYDFRDDPLEPDGRTLRMTLVPFARLRLELDGKAAPDPSETARLDAGSGTRLVVPGSLGSLGIAGAERVRILPHLAPGPFSLRWRGSTYALDLEPGESRTLTLPTDPPALSIECLRGGAPDPSFTSATLVPLGDPNAPELEASYVEAGRLLARRHVGPALLLLREAPGSLPLALEVDVPEQGPLQVSLPSAALPVEHPDSGPRLRVFLVSLASTPLERPIELATERDAGGAQRIPAAPAGSTLRIEGLDGTDWVRRDVIVPEDPSAGVHWP